MNRNLLLIAMLLALAEASAASPSVENNLPCRLLFILLAVVPAVGVIIITLEAVRWFTSPDDAWTRGNAVKGILYVTIGLVVILITVPSAVFLTAGSGGFYSCIQQLSGVSQVKTPEALSDTVFISALSLYDGWNLFSTPIVLDEPNASILFNGVGYDILYSWNALSGEWEYLTPEGGVLNAIEIDRGYWIHMRENATVLLRGRAPLLQRNISLAVGWNLVGYSAYSTASVSKMLDGVDYTYLYAWNSTQALASVYGGGWSYHSKTGLAPSKAPPKPPAMKEPSFHGLANLTQLEPGRGYWIYVNKSTSWVYSPGYPA